MTKLVISAIAAVGLLVAPANAATIVFKGDGQTAFTTTADADFTCGSGLGSGDACTAADKEAAGLSYTDAGLDFTVFAFEDFGNVGGVRDYASVIQDVQPGNSGLGVYSTGEDRNGKYDQVQSSQGESLLFDFSSNPDIVAISNIEFNAGDDVDCSAFQADEGPCDYFNIYIDGVLLAGGPILAVDLLTKTFVGSTFEFVALSKNNPSGFVIAQFDIAEVPIPGALPLLLSGIAGLGFAARRKKTA